MREASTLQPWIFRPKPKPAARLRLFCVPYAGRGASVYREWPDLLGDSVELCALQLPGRENRLRERPFNRMPELVREAAGVLESYLDLPYALFGHSLGAMVCFELARTLRNQHGNTPVHLFVSARRAPQLPDRRPLLSSMSDEGFVAEIRHRYNGISVEIFNDRELMALLLPTLRADVEMLDTYEYQSAPPLDCPITAFGGQNDRETLFEELAGWRNQTSVRFETYILPGDHFFLQTAAADMTEIICRKLDYQTRKGSGLCV
jgi:surfactin synthase thioesterase subunit